jgi:predicted phosphate transport protein (TIGR00153 family)
MFGERDSQFFHLFETAAANVATASQALLNLICNMKDKETKIAELEDLEHMGDDLTHDIISELHKAFITPIDREDIFLLAKEIDNIVDSIEATAHRFIMLNVCETTPQAEELAKMINESAKQLVLVMHELRKLKHIAVDNKTIIEINNIEDAGDKIYRKAVKELYSGAYDALTVIKWREIYDHLEDTLDAFEDVANIIEGIAMKHS